MTDTANVDGAGHVATRADVQRPTAGGDASGAPSSRAANSTAVVQPAGATPVRAVVGPDVTEALGKVLKIAGAVVAPTTLLTALLFYFGRQHAFALFDYFGVPSSVFELTTQDYLVRSADGLFVPFASTAALTLAVLWGRSWFLRAVSQERRQAVGRRAAPVLAVLGIAAAGVAVVGVRDPDAFARVPELPGLLLAGGALLVAAAVQVVRRRAPDPRASPVPFVAEWAAVFLLVAVGLFWSVGNYAGEVGRGRAVQIAGELSSTPDAVVFSEKRLALGGVPGVSEYVCADDAVKDDSAYRFRYDGLKLVLQSGGQYLFLPAGWTWEVGPAVVIPRTDSLRLEFSAPGRAQVGSC